jgi:hypothetical protein
MDAQFCSLGEALDHAGRMIIDQTGTPTTLRQEIAVASGAMLIILKQLHRSARAEERRIRNGTRRDALSPAQQRAIEVLREKAVHFEARVLDETAARLEALVSRDRTAWLSRN